MTLFRVRSSLFQDGPSKPNGPSLGMTSISLAPKSGDVRQKATFNHLFSSLAGHSYEIQPEYSNQAHASVYTPRQHSD
jgi:hypothetical protein